MITLKRLSQQKRIESSALFTGFPPLFPPSLLSPTFLNSLCDRERVMCKKLPGPVICECLLPGTDFHYFWNLKRRSS